MGFERIENVKPAPTGKVPDGGARWAVRQLTVAPARGGGVRQYIKLTLSPGLVRKLAMPPQFETTPVALLFGTGTDAGKIAVQVDGKGDFAAKMARDGSRSVTLSAATCDGMFALTEKFSCDVVDVPVTMAQGQPPLAVIALPDAALAED